ncbi:MAG: SRPBCC domain-containing protein [Saprospiraceae bacterium]|nr:SRPBCC domain-containing protein [Saprospiraceae bacterium]
MEDIIRKQKQFKHPIARVWEAISVADQISTWFIQADFKAEVGYHYTFTHQGTKITGEVLIASPVHELVYTWMVSGTETVTTVRWILTEYENGTILTLEHSGISGYPATMAVTMFENFNNGWHSCVENLEKHLAGMN